MLGISKISSFARKCISFSTQGVKLVESAPKISPKTPQTAINPTNTNDLFCHQYWSKMKEKGYLKEMHCNNVDMHGYLNGINHHFTGYPQPQYLNVPAAGVQLTPKEMITLSDFQFKALKPTKDNMTVFRCIGEKPDFFFEHKLYKKRLGIKKGDVIDMKEYAYATSDRSYAQGYLTNNRGILYEIEVPKGARISQTGCNTQTDEIVFPRSSRFECISTEKIKDENSDYLKIKLKYILPDEKWNAMA